MEDQAGRGPRSQRDGSKGGKEGDWEAKAAGVRCRRLVRLGGASEGAERAAGLGSQGTGARSALPCNQVPRPTGAPDFKVLNLGSAPS